MISVADGILKRAKAKGRGNWVFAARDFLDLGNRAAVDQALSRLTKDGVLRRVGRGLYDLPRWSKILRKLAPVRLDSAVDAVARRDGIRVMPGGLKAANALRLTNAVPARIMYDTDGPTRDVRVGGYTIHFRHAPPRVMRWADQPSEPVAQALLWFGPRIASNNPEITDTLKRILPDAVKENLLRNSANLPAWAASIARDVASSKGAK